MDWRLIFATFVMIFVAELGDKTQLLVFARTAETRAPLQVFIAASAALIASTLLGVLFGGLVSKLPDWLVKGVAGLVFIGFGIWTLIQIKR